MKQKYAEDLPYWKTGRSSEKAINEALNAITKAGGKITGEGFLTRDGTGVFFVEFTMDGDRFRYIEPVMKSTYGDNKAAEVQAAASLKHAIKARINEALRHGARRAFIGSLLLPNGSVVHQQSNEILQELFAPMITTALPSGEIVEGEIE